MTVGSRRKNGAVQFRCSYQTRCGVSVSSHPHTAKEAAFYPTGDELLTVARAAVASSIPATIREDIIQELAVGILENNFDVRDLEEAVRHCRQKMNRNEADRYRHVFIDHALPGTDNRRFDMAG